jgi:hypothetical protein
MNDMYHTPHLIPARVFRKLLKRYGTQIEHGIVMHSYSAQYPDNHVTVAVRKPESNDSVYQTCLKSEVSGYLFAISDNM